MRYLRRLNAVFIALCVQNVVHAISSVETRPDARKSLSFFDFFQNYVLFLSRLRYSRRLHARFTSFYMQIVVYAFSSVERRPNHTQIAIILRFSSKLCVISLPFEIFTSFTRSFYLILHAERSVRVFQRRKKTKHTQIAIIRRFFR